MIDAFYLSDEQADEYFTGEDSRIENKSENENDDEQ